MVPSINQCVQKRTHTACSKTGNAFAITVADAVRRHLDGDRSAMTDIVRRVSPWLNRLARGYRLSPEAAEDVVQNTLLALWQNVGRLRDPQTAVAWMSVTARHEALRMIKIDGRAIPVGDMTELDRLGDATDPEQALLTKVTRRAIRRNLAKLPTRSRDLLQLAFLADVRDYATVSATLDLPVGSIGPTRRRGLERMRELLDADEDWRLNESA
jgi:RNA polymerase sigma factor (sigma-70 family)